MLKANHKNALHKAVMIRVLIHILDDLMLSKNLFFKGGTCASMLGYLSRFSVDLDFDIKDRDVQKNVQEKLEGVFKNLELSIDNSSANTSQYFLKYDAPQGERNTIKVDAVAVPFKNNKYEKKYLTEVNRYSICQTKDTLFANKLVALIDRYERNNSIAGRDVYDIHRFLLQNFAINDQLIQERRGVNTSEYLKLLIDFIDQNITQTIINQDLNYLLAYSEFNAIRKTLKQETIALLKSRL